jgi:hypothetical protein
MAPTIGVKDSFAGGSLGTLYTDRRNFYLNPNMVTELWPSSIPFTTFSRKMSKKKTGDPDYKMFKHDSEWEDMKFVVKAGYTDTALPAAKSSLADVDVDIDGSTSIVPYVGLKVDIYDSTLATYKGQAIVKSVDTAADHIDIVVTDRSGTPDVVAGDYMLVTGHASEEGSGSPEAWADDLETSWNSAGIFKTSVEVTGTLYEMALRGYSKEFARLQVQKRHEHAIKEEKDYLFSRRIGGTASAPDHAVGANGKLIRTTHGAVPILKGESRNYTVDTSSPSEGSVWQQFVKTAKDSIFEYSNEKGIKYGFAGDGFLYEVDKMVDAKVTRFVKGKENRFGFDIRTLETPFGILKLVRSPLLTRTHGGIYTNECLIVDPETISHVTYRRSKYQSNIQANDIDGQKDQYFSDSGIAITQPKKSCMVKFAAVA